MTPLVSVVSCPGRACRRWMPASLLAAALAIAACSSPPQQQTPAATGQPVATQAPPAAAAATTTPPAANPAGVGVGAAGSTTLPAPIAVQPPPTASVFFAFDEYTIADEYLAPIERLGRYLVANPQVTLRLEGHADERGSHEYNLALGQRRAEAVARALRTLGVRESQMEAVSFGEERPRAVGQDEISWAKNRRADAVYR